MSSPIAVQWLVLQGLIWSLRSISMVLLNWGGFPHDNDIPYETHSHQVHTCHNPVQLTNLGPVAVSKDLSQSEKWMTDTTWFLASTQLDCIFWTNMTWHGELKFPIINHNTINSNLDIYPIFDESLAIPSVFLGQT